MCCYPTSNRPKCTEGGRLPVVAAPRTGGLDPVVGRPRLGFAEKKEAFLADLIRHGQSDGSVQLASTRRPTAACWSA